MQVFFCIWRPIASMTKKVERLAMEWCTLWLRMCVRHVLAYVKAEHIQCTVECACVSTTLSGGGEPREYSTNNPLLLLWCCCRHFTQVYALLNLDERLQIVHCSPCGSFVRSQRV